MSFFGGQMVIATGMTMENPSNVCVMVIWLHH